MNEELKWLAENMHVWPEHQVWLWCTYDNDGNHTVTFIDPNNLNDPNGPEWIDAIYHNQWQAARDELSGKPSWNDAPPEAEVLFQNANGHWLWAYGSQNEVTDSYFVFDYHLPTYACGEVLGDWRDTLEWRPLNHSKPTEKTWSGSEDGLPPVGTKCMCEYYSSGLNKHEVTIVAYADSRVWVDIEMEYVSRILDVNEIDFKPLPTEEDKTVEKMMRIMEGGLTEVAARALYRCGLRFTEQTEGTK